MKDFLCFDRHLRIPEGLLVKFSKLICLLDYQKPNNCELIYHRYLIEVSALVILNAAIILSEQHDQDCRVRRRWLDKWKRFYPYVRHRLRRYKRLCLLFGTGLLLLLNDLSFWFVFYVPYLCSCGGRHWGKMRERKLYRLSCSSVLLSAVLLLLGR